MRRLPSLAERSQSPVWSTAIEAATHAAEGMKAFSAAMNEMNLEQAKAAGAQALIDFSNSLSHFEVLQKAAGDVVTAARKLRSA